MWGTHDLVVAIRPTRAKTGDPGLPYFNGIVRHDCHRPTSACWRTFPVSDKYLLGDHTSHETFWPARNSPLDQDIVYLPDSQTSRLVCHPIPSCKEQTHCRARLFGAAHIYHLFSTISHPPAAETFLSLRLLFVSDCRAEIGVVGRRHKGVRRRQH